MTDDPNRPLFESIQAERLATELLADGRDGKSARKELSRASHAVSDRVANLLAAQLPQRADRIVAAVAVPTPALWFESGRQLLVTALRELAVSRPELLAHVSQLQSMPARGSGPEGTGLLRRVGNLYGSALVIAFLLFPAVIALIAGAFVPWPTVRVALLVGGGAVIALVPLVGAFTRRCPACRRLLAGIVAGYRHSGLHTERMPVTTTSGTQVNVEQHVDTYASQFRCVHCGHRWE